MITIINYFICTFYFYALVIKTQITNTSLHILVVILILVLTKIKKLKNFLITIKSIDIYGFICLMY